MNTYDFDKTIFPVDSTREFLLFCARKYPRIVLKAMEGAALPLFRYYTGGCDTKELKEKLFAFLPQLWDVDAEVEEFWEKNFHRIEPWYLEQKRDDDVIISASPDFILAPAAEKLGVKLIATRMNKYTGKICGKNCHDYEKVCRFYAEFPQGRSDTFYSDSTDDRPMANISEKAYLVKNGVLTEWK